jgi:hypothetical protein
MPRIVIDSREQLPYEFPAQETVIERLDVGDYTYEGHEHEFAVERKSLNDLANSVGTDRNRFENEIRRANGWAERNEDGNPLPGTKPDYELDNFVVVIEAPRQYVAHYAGTKSSPHYYSNIYPNSILGTLDSWRDKYETLDFIWSGSREEARQRTLQFLDQWLLTSG